MNECERTHRANELITRLAAEIVVPILFHLDDLTELKAILDEEKRERKEKGLV